MALRMLQQSEEEWRITSGGIFSKGWEYLQGGYVHSWNRNIGLEGLNVNAQARIACKRCCGVGEGCVPHAAASDGVQSSVACSADINLARSYLLLRRR